MKINNIKNINDINDSQIASGNKIAQVKISTRTTNDTGKSEKKRSVIAFFKKNIMGIVILSIITGIVSAFLYDWLKGCS